MSNKDFIKEYPLSEGQKLIFIHYHVNSDQSTYNEPFAWYIHTRVDVENLRRSFIEFMKRHEVFRSIFVLEQEPVQKVYREPIFDFECLDMEDADDVFLRNYFSSEARRPFVLEEGVAFRVRVLRISDEKYILHFVCHHIVLDGWTLSLMLDEVGLFYKHFCEGSELRLNPVMTQYSDFVAWQKDVVLGEQREEATRFWKKKLSDELPILSLPTNPKSPTKLPEQGSEFSFSLHEETTRELRDFCQKHHSTVNTVLFSLYSALLSRLTGQEHIVIGTPRFGRKKKDFRMTAGYFVNMLPIQIQLSKKDSFRDLLHRVREEMDECLQYQDFPFAQMVEECVSTQDNSHHPIFQTVFVLQKAWKQDGAIVLGNATNLFDVHGLPFETIKIVKQNPKFNLSLHVEEEMERICCHFEYNHDVLDVHTVKRFTTYFDQLVRSFLDHPDGLISEVCLVPESEQRQLLEDWNRTQTEYPRESTIHELFEKQVKCVPEDIAVVYKEQQLTYRELDEKANQLAHYLQKRGIGPESLVGLYMERSPEMMIGILGILKAGGAYVPLDLSYPENRLSYMLEDADIGIMITEKEVKLGWISEKVDMICFDRDQEIISQESKLAPISEVTAENVAYVIYTSGSTGNPKGVIVGHRAVVRLVQNTNYLDFSQKHRILQTGSIVFDASTFEIWGSLLNGGELYLIDKDQILTPHELKAAIERYQITTMWLTAPFFCQLVEQDEEIFAGLKHLLVGGDALSPEHINKVKRRYAQLRIYNGYGPTENTTFSTVYEITKEHSENIPIGKPIANSTAYVMSSQMKLQPIGVMGELCVGGDGLARGYLHNPELTAEKFMDHPFVPGEKLYRTGDLVKMLEDGNIVFMGRIDHQVKIRGYRVEPGEIAQQLVTHEAIKEAYVMVHQEDSGKQYLCAYYVTNGEVGVPEIRRYARELLPDYMVPSHFVEMDLLPLTLNGKVDRRALPEPDQAIQSHHYVEPTNETEAKLVSIWREVLGLKQVGTQDHFFDRGGHSLKAMTLVSKIQREFEVEFSLQEVFQAPVVKEMASLIQEATQSVYASIPVAESREYYPVSSEQKRMYMIQQMDLHSVGYNMPNFIRVKGKLDIDRLEHLFRQLIQRHASFRTSFVMIEGEPRQMIASEVPFSITRVEATHQDAKRIVDEFTRPFDLSQAPLFRSTVVTLTSEESLLLLDMHHIISDGVSTSLFFEEMKKLDRGETLPEIPVQYKDYAVWQQELQGSEWMKKQEKYWLSAMDGEIPVLNLPTDYPRPLTRSFEGSNVEFYLHEELTQKLKQLARSQDTTLYMTLLALYTTLLHKYSTQEDIIVGSITAGRPHPDVENVMGMFVNTLAMRSYPAGTKSFDQFLQEVKENVLEAFKYQDYPLEELVDKLNVPRDLSRNPLFDTLFAMQNLDMSEITLDGLTLSPYEYEYHVSKFDLTLDAAEKGDRLWFNFEYDVNLFERETIERMASHLSHLATQVCQDPEKAIAELTLVTSQEQETLQSLNETTVLYPNDQTIVGLFEEQVVKYPDNVAVVYEKKQITYRELNQRANQLARYLQKQGVGSESLVGLCVERSLEMMIGVLGILKAGGAYIPLDPMYPEKRLQYMLEDANIQLVVTQKSLSESKWLPESIQSVCLDRDQVEIEKESTENLMIKVSPNHLAYVIYTSGSTGNPKGVMVEHHNVIRLMKSTEHWYQFDERDTWTLFHSYAFDFSVWEIWGALLYGGKLVVVPYWISRSPKDFYQLLIEEQVTVLNQTPSAFRQLIQVCEQEDEKQSLYLRYVIFGGEALEPTSLLPWFERYGDQKPQLVNMYGITETTVHVTYHPITKEDTQYSSRSNIGKRIPDLEVYVLDAYGQPVPMGVVGELYIGGAGLARGYLNRPELTAERFLPHPFSHDLEARLYRTGDLARYLADGNLDYLGRIDHQVKIRGFRIELGEIESALNTHATVKEAVVIVREDQPGDKQLVAYIVGSGDITVWREYLKAQLPSHMIPAYFVQMEVLPLTVNGKIDRNRLPKPDLSGQVYHYVKPTNETEVRLASIWQEVLGIGRVGTRDHFFDLGGHSLKAMRLVSKIQKEFEVDFGLQEVFQTSTLKEMAKRIREASQSIYAEIPVTQSREYYPVSSVQKRMYAIQQTDLDSVSYNMPITMRIKGDLDVDRLEEAICQLIKRHESFRTSFAMIEGEAQQIIAPEVSFSIARMKSTEQEAKRLVEEFVRPFHLNEAPLLRAAMIQIDSEESLLLLDMHHVISDGVSTDLFFTELMQLYRGEEVPALRIQYKDYAVWQQEIQESEWMGEQEKYWLKTMTGEIPVLHLPTDYPRPLTRSLEGSHVVFQLNAEATYKLKQLSRDHDTTLYMTLLTLYTTFLHKYSAQEDIIVGSPIAGRPHADLENIMGMFVNTLALRSYPSSDKTFSQLLQEVKEHMLEGLKHQDYPFEKLVEKLNISRDLSRNPLFDTMFAMQNTDMTDLILGDLTLTPYEQEYKGSKFDLTLSAAEEGDGLCLNLEYDTHLFKRETIERMVSHFLHLIDQVCQDPEREIAELALVTKQEEEILERWNDTRASYPTNQTIVELFEAQVEKTPEQIAVVYKAESLTYKELDRRSNQLAHTLRAKGVGRETIVGLMVENSIEMIVGALGILKAGGAYLPIDREYPQARIDHMIEDSGTNLLLIQSHLVENITTKREIESLTPEYWYQGSKEPVSWKGSPSDLAYVIYTSGSTGKPKGVMVEHRSLVNLSCWHVQEFEITEQDNSTKLASVGFDASVWETFPYLVAGATIHIIPDEMRLDLYGLNQYFEQNRITISFLPTQLGEQFMELDNQSLRILHAGGDKLTKYIPRDYTLVNNYGPTENTVVATSFVVDEVTGNIPIGKPIDNVRVYVLNSCQQLQPIGVIGELCIGGEGLARGYLNKPELTAEKFVDSPFVPGEKLYRTGDLVRMLDDGNIAFMGRIDHQVKIRGYRIELDEITSVLLSHPAVKEAVVAHRLDAKNQAYLCAYIVSEQEWQTEDLKSHLSRNVPIYMIPAAFVRMEEIPLTVNGKVDLQSLPEPELSTPSQNVLEPTNDIEAKLVSVWQDVLGVDPISINQSFYELGGDSIKAVQIAARLNSYSLKLEVKHLLQHPTIQELAKYVKAKKVEISQGLVEGEVNLSPIQEWFFERDFVDRHHWNQAMMMRHEGRLDPDIVEQVFQKIVDHHDALRMRYRFEDGVVTQINHGLGSRHFTLESIDLRMGSEDSLHDRVQQEATRLNGSLDLEEGPLVRLGIIQTKEADHVLIVIHHLVIDGVSWRILLEDFVQGYQQALSGQEVKFQPKTHSYQEWTSELKKYADSHKIQNHIDYWKGIEHTAIQLLPKDASGTMNRWAESDTVSIQLDTVQTENLLKKVHQAYKTEINDLLLISLGQAIQEWSGETQILIQLEGHGREEILEGIDINRTVGWFTSAYPVILDMKHSKDLSLQLKTTKEMLRNIPNKGIDYGIIRYLSKEDLEWNLLPEISFNYLGQFDQDRTSEAFGFSKLPVGEMFSSRSDKLFPIDITGLIEHGRLHLQFSYSTQQYSKETISSIAHSYKNHLLEVMKHCMEKEEVEVTPSDFTSSTLSMDELDDIFGELSAELG
ncbi:amino acid adenylation domain-containing protein/non-ribosomal peptide synthase protein (TIGR01720 family) [Croceifilum oryzae]|uniref:Amino acid adenylation domain-containing protein/non-ribosomal peptide synthase protein (TIGR01720 family) n=1 Tax=Croceifilum oryzae TaxID=1553429 RepID=A0AAJ1THS7_9BACL|nr:non-ribosomal peptide synthetase [Croceifilum oryzae]MDQ0416436.1 amino acid adenylation domain-containing protein/non-ribosomal peptide synthase protein (TIGR01720 family) [Croceifilum oryzae]